jgi:hypothetical protein
MNSFNTRTCLEIAPSLPSLKGIRLSGGGIRPTCRIQKVCEKRYDIHECWKSLKGTAMYGTITIPYTISPLFWRAWIGTIGEVCMLCCLLLSLVFGLWFSVETPVSIQNLSTYLGINTCGLKFSSYGAAKEKFGTWRKKRGISLSPSRWVATYRNVDGWCCVVIEGSVS